MANLFLTFYIYQLAWEYNYYKYSFCHNDKICDIINIFLSLFIVDVLLQRHFPTLVPVYFSCNCCMLSWISSVNIIYIKSKYMKFQTNIAAMLNPCCFFHLNVGLVKAKLVFFTFLNWDVRFVWNNMQKLTIYHACNTYNLWLFLLSSKPYIGTP